MKRIRFKQTASLALGLLLIAAVFSGCDDPVQEASDPPSGDGEVTLASSYSDVYKAVEAASSADSRDGMIFMEEATAEDDSVDSTAASPDSGSSDYSETNVQVSGVDEGDIVKTDGEHIFILRENRLLIAEPNGADTRILSSTDVCEKESETSYESPGELYIYGDYAAVISYYNSWEEYSEDDAWVYEDTTITKLYIYDVSDPAAPSLVHELGQDGYNLTSRLIDGTLYLLSTYSVYEPDEDDPDTFVPALYRDGSRELISADSIVIPPGISSASYTVICVYDLTEGALSESQTVLGGGSTVYVNRDNLYLASSVYATAESEPYTQDNYTVIDYTSEAETDILRFDISAGGITLSANGSVPGYLSDQFAMDEYNGYLRLVTTVSTSSWATYTDEKYGWSNSEWEDDYTASALYVLGSALDTVGATPELAEDEQVYSVRFDGDIGYFVTFRQTDPLFAVDLSDPADPKVLSALKIPGFSEYLHLYGDGRLFGLGMAADEETGITDGMKLTMFDTGDPVDVTEKHTLLLDSYYSTALYNHRAILISAEKDIIAFPTAEGYDVYGYSDDDGFYQRAQISADEWGYDARGLYIGDIVYIVTDTGINVLDMLSFEAAGYIAF